MYFCLLHKLHSSSDSQGIKNLSILMDGCQEQR